MDAVHRLNGDGFPSLSLVKRERGGGLRYSRSLCESRSWQEELVPRIRHVSRSMWFTEESLLGPVFFFFLSLLLFSFSFPFFFTQRGEGREESKRKKKDLVGVNGETATTSKEGSRRANYPILTQGGSDNK